MKKNMKRWLVIGGVVAVIIAYVFIQVQAGMKKSSAGVMVDLSKLQRTNLVTTVSGSGQVDAEDKAQLRAEINGLVTKVLVKEGQRVRKGDLLVQFDDRQYVNALQTALVDEQALEQSKIHLASTRKTYQHTLELFKNGAASQEQLDQAELTLSQEEKQVAQSTQLAGIKLSNARLDLDRTKVRATRNGIILFCPAKEGMAVTPGTELCQIGELSKLVVELPVDEIDITQIKLGQPATITQEGLTELKLKGTVIAIAPQAVKNQNENVFPVKIRIDNSSGMLRSGMSVDTEIVTNDLKDVLTVPLLAVLEEEHKGKTEKYLFKVIDGKAVKTKITAGFSSDSELEVLGGIKEGDTYVSGDYETILHLKDKTAVRQRVLKPQAQPKANQ
ncbi:MAG TPA: efflux RND transporter periplasmic adaptor subunit [Bacillota bacterium]